MIPVMMIMPVMPVTAERDRHPRVRLGIDRLRVIDRPPIRVIIVAIEIAMPMLANRHPAMNVTISIVIMCLRRRSKESRGDSGAANEKQFCDVDIHRTASS